MRAFVSVLILSLISTGSIPLTSADNLILPAKDCLCNAEQPDRFEEPIRYDYGAYKGQCVDSCIFRRVIFLNNKQARKYGGDATHVVIANVLHEGRHWIARVPVTKVEDVDAGFERFLSTISHVVLRFHFSPKDPVLLFTQKDVDRPGKPKSTKQIDDLVLSAEAVPPKGHPLVFMDSSMGKYLLDYRMLSIEDVVQWMVIDKKHHVKQYRLNTDAKMREHLIRAAMLESTNKSFKSAYQLFTNNCATSLINFIYQEVKYTPTIYDTLGLVNFQAAIPIDSYFGTIYALGAMHLLGASSQIQNLEDEFGQRTSHVGGSKLLVDRPRRGNLSRH